MGWRVACLVVSFLLVAGCAGPTGETGSSSKGTAKAAPPSSSWHGVSSSSSSGPGPSSPGGAPPSRGPSTAGPGTVPSSSQGQGPSTIDSATGPDINARDTPRPALLPLTVRTDVTLGPGAGEPNIVVAPDGGIYITPIDHVYRSLNGGQSFQDLGTSKTDGHGDGDLTVDAQGRLYWLGLSGSSGAIPFQSSDDQGTTWTAPTDLSGNQGTDREWIDATPDGVVHAYWRDNRGLVYRHSGDRGATWGPAVIMRGDAGADGPIVHDPTDPHRVYVSVPDGNGIELLVSEDDGASWDQHLVAPGPSDFFNPAFPTSLFPVAAVDTAGTVYVVWSWSQASPSVTKVLTRQGVLLTYSVDHGLHWSTPIPLSDGGKDGRMPWITAGRPGRVAVTWYQSVLGPGAANDVVPDEWDVKLWESVTADSPAPVAQTVTLSSSPNHIGSVCTMGLFCAAGGDRCLLDYFEDTTDVAGQPVATWSSCVLGTGVGVAVQGTDIHFGGVTGGTPLW